MILCLANRALALTALSVAATATICIFPAGADSTEKDVNPTGTEIRQATPRPPKASVDAGGPMANPVLAIPLAKLSVTLDRPIFSPSRRPPAPPAVPFMVRQVEPVKPTEPEHPPLILVGTVSGEDSGIAVFVEQSTENTVRLRVSESHQGWTLRSIQGREVTLLKGGKSNVLALAPPGGSAEPANAQAVLEPVKKSRR